MLGNLLRKLADAIDGKGPVPNQRYEIAAKSAGAIVLRGNGQFDFEVVGEAHCQNALEEICGGRTEEGHNLEKVALLVNDNGNDSDKDAVAVFIDTKRVGYLPRSVATDFRRQTTRLNPSGASVGCRATIKGGWQRSSNDRGHFGVWLDVSSPIEIATRSK